jgi:hypothetical protein
MARTKGAKNVAEFALKTPSRCPRCGSTNRGPYTNRKEEECVTTVGNGLPVTHRISQLTDCTDCGQKRYDISFDNRTPLPPDKQAAKTPPPATKPATVDKPAAVKPPRKRNR